MNKLVPNYTTGRPFRDRVSGAQALETFYHALLSKKTTFKKQHANKTSMGSREHLPCCCGFWGRWLASMKRLLIRVPAKLPPHYTAEQHRHCSWPRKCKDVLYLWGLKLLRISTFERLCVKHFLFILNSNPNAELKDQVSQNSNSVLYSAYSAIQNLYDFS